MFMIVFRTPSHALREHDGRMVKSTTWEINQAFIWRESFNEARDWAEDRATAMGHETTFVIGEEGDIIQIGGEF